MKQDDISFPDLCKLNAIFDMNYQTEEAWTEYQRQKIAGDIK